MEENNPLKKSATDEEIQELVAERLLINAIKRRQARQNDPQSPSKNNAPAMPATTNAGRNPRA